MYLILGCQQSILAQHPGAPFDGVATALSPGRAPKTGALQGISFEKNRDAKDFGSSSASDPSKNFRRYLYLWTGARTESKSCMPTNWT